MNENTPNDELADILDDMEKGSRLDNTLARMPADQFNKLTQAMQNQIAKRNPIDVANLTDQEFDVYKRYHGV
jgi:hypothetical protein